MARNTSSLSLNGILRQYFPAVESPSPATDPDGVQLSHIIYPTTNYTDNEKVEIGQWLSTSNQLAMANEDEAKHAERLGSLNIHLSTRTTLLGSKPSIADVALYSRLAPSVKAWSREERTGERGYHHIVRYIDFVQNAPLFGMTIEKGDRVTIDPSDVLFVHKPLDAKEEKERKKKEKAAAAAASSSADAKPLVVGQGKGVEGGKSKKEKAKDVLTSTKDTIAGAIPGAATPAKKEKKEKKEKAPKSAKAPAKETPLSPSLIDLRVGHILKAVAHPNADSLYVSTIAVGDPPGAENTSEYEGQVVRTVCSGLNGLVPLAEMQGRKIVAVCNLKPVTMRGVKSAAMVLAASPRLKEGEVDNHAGPVELVDPPADAEAGQRVCFVGWEGEPEGVLNPKKKVWEMCQVGFTTTEDLRVGFERGAVEQLRGEAGEGKPEVGRLMVKDGGACTVKSLEGAIVR